MNDYLKRHAKQLAIKQLMKTPVGEKLQQAVQLVQSIQEHLAALSEKEEEPNVTGAKAVTILTFAVLKKIADGKSPSSFDTEDWKELAYVTLEYTTFLDGEKYSVFVFQLYEKFIRASAELIGGFASYEVVGTIEKLADELHSKEELFKNGDLPEVMYTEDCLWISLEAMVKLLASTVYLFRSQQVSEFTQAFASCAFEYGRLMLYRKEQMLVEQFIESQYRLDEELEEKYAEYLYELEAKSEQFHTLIDHAFAPNFRTAFLHSILLANAAGVKESDILSSAEDIDSFFLC